LQSFLKLSAIAAANHIVSFDPNNFHLSVSIRSISSDRFIATTEITVIVSYTTSLYRWLFPATSNGRLLLSN
jgi:hypothetical protein